MTRLHDDPERLAGAAGGSRVELLLFKLGTRQLFGINVFKVHEAIQCPKLTALPGAHSVVCGVATLRDKTVSVIDLAMAIGGIPHPRDGSGYIIITEYSRSTHGFLVSALDRIIHLDWRNIQPPPKGTGRYSYITAVTQYDHELIEIIDVEKVIHEVTGSNEHISDGVITHDFSQDGKHILVVDDSSVARHQITNVLDALKINYTIAKDGQEAWDRLSRWADEGKEFSRFLSMIISDIEMPRMDGYTLTSRIRGDARMKDIYVLLHTSLSGVYNQDMIEKTGADKFLAKYDPDELAEVVQTSLTEHRHHLAL
ncbi:MAG: chemotaxis protein CheV [Methylococcaceae bacterium]|nr:MAG: chemotaxis protein CheV [Methylococcaceae bacterium]